MHLQRPIWSNERFELGDRLRSVIRLGLYTQQHRRPHRLGLTKTLQQFRETDDDTHGMNIGSGSLTDSCTTAITGLFARLIGAPRYSMPRKITADGKDAVRRTRQRGQDIPVGSKGRR
jgi:hypothetical protein